MGVDRPGEQGESGTGGHAGEPGLCDLHVRIDGAAEGSGDRAPAAGELRKGDRGEAGNRSRGPAGAGIDVCGGPGEHGVVSGFVLRGEAACDDGGSGGRWTGAGRIL